MSWIEDEYNKKKALENENELFHNTFNEKFPQASSFIEYLQESKKKVIEIGYNFQGSSSLKEKEKLFEYRSDYISLDRHRSANISFQLVKKDSLFIKVDFLEWEYFDTYSGESGFSHKSYHQLQSFSKILDDEEQGNFSDLSITTADKILGWVCFKENSMK